MQTTGVVDEEPYKYLTPEVIKSMRYYIDKFTAASDIETILKETLDNINNSTYYSRREVEEDIKGELVEE